MASDPRFLPVTDPELDAPDGAVVDGMERVGDQWRRRTNDPPADDQGCFVLFRFPGDWWQVAKPEDMAYLSGPKRWKRIDVRFVRPVDLAEGVTP